MDKVELSPHELHEKGRPSGWGHGLCAVSESQRPRRGQPVSAVPELEREGLHQGKDDLVAAGHANLPRWTQGSAAQFWQAADTYERPSWVVSRHLQVALPRELSSEGRLELAHDLCEVMVGKFPHSWAVHEPEARDGSGIQPYVHRIGNFIFWIPEVPMAQG